MQTSRRLAPVIPIRPHDGPENPPPRTNPARFTIRGLNRNELHVLSCTLHALRLSGGAQHAA